MLHQKPTILGATTLLRKDPLACTSAILHIPESAYATYLSHSGSRIGLRRWVRSVPSFPLKLKSFRLVMLVVRVVVRVMVPAAVLLVLLLVLLVLLVLVLVQLVSLLTTTILTRQFRFRTIR